MVSGKFVWKVCHKGVTVASWNFQQDKTSDVMLIAGYVVPAYNSCVANLDFSY